MFQEDSHNRDTDKELGKHKDRLHYADWICLTFDFNHSVQGPPVCEKPQVKSFLKISRHLLI